MEVAILTVMFTTLVTIVQTVFIWHFSKHVELERERKKKEARAAKNAGCNCKK